MTSTSSATGIDKVVNAIESLSTLLSALSPEELAAHQQTITPRASRLVSQLTAIANSTGDHAGPAKPSSTEPPTLTRQSLRSPTHAQVKTEPSLDSQVDGTISPVPANPLKRPSGSPPSSPQPQQEHPPPNSTASTPAPPPNSLASLFAERAARLESQQRQRQASEQQEAPRESESAPGRPRRRPGPGGAAQARRGGQEAHGRREGAEGAPAHAHRGGPQGQAGAERAGEVEEGGVGRGGGRCRRRGGC